MGIVGVLFSDVIYGLARLDGEWAVGGPVDIGWVIFYAALGYAAMVPSMRQLSVPATTELAGAARRRPPGAVHDHRVADRAGHALPAVSAG